MKRIAFPLILTFMLVWAMPAHALVDVNVGYGTTFQLDGVLQWQTYGQWAEHNESYGQEDNWTFQIPRLRILMSGQLVNENISYFVELDPTDGGNMCPDCDDYYYYYPSDKTSSGSSSDHVPTLLDVKLNFAGIIPNTVITFGRFKPAWSYFMPRNTADLYLVTYPVVTQMFGMWRQVGIQTTTTTDMIDFYFGVFNGRALCADSFEDLLTGAILSSNNWKDNNKYKDIFAKAVFKWEGFFLAPSFWYGWPHDDSEFTYYTLGGEVGYVKDGLTVVGEVQTMHYDFDGEDLDQMGAYIHVGYFFMEKWEGLFRWDYFDFIDGVDEVEDDENMYFTVGLNYFPDLPVHAKVSAQYTLTQYGDLWKSAPFNPSMYKTTVTDGPETNHQMWLQISLFF
jgi:hypothetical protein